MKMLKSFLIYFFLLGGAILFTFWKLPQTFYQQDEWLGLGQIWAQGWSHVVYGFSPVQILFADGRPLTRVLGVILFGKFPFNSLFLSIFSIGFHFVNSVLVFFIAYKLLKSRFYSFIAALFFSVNSVTNQSITWFGASFGTQPGSFFVFLSILIFFYFLERRKNIYLYSSLFLGLLSLYFKESGIFLFLFFPLLEIIYLKNFNSKKYFKKYLPFILFISLFVAFRLYEMMVVRANSSGILAGRVFANLGNQYIFQSLVLRSFMYPLTSLGYIFIPVPFALLLGYYMRVIYYPYVTLQPGMISETVILDFISVIFAFIVLTLLYFVWRRNKGQRRSIITSLALFVLSILPYIVISKTFGYLEPRYYYISSAAAGILLALTVSNLAKINNLLKFISTSFIIILLFAHIKTIKGDINYQAVIGKERKSFISQLYKEIPTLENSKNIFLVEGSKTRFSKHNYAPFQNGIGYTLMVLYYKSGKIPNELLSEGYLWDWDNEGYREVNRKGFGYFYDFNDLKKYLSKNDLDPNIVTALYYNSASEKLTNITREVRGDLAKP